MTRKVQQLSLLEHMGRKSMWGGSNKLTNVEVFIITPENNTFVRKKIKFYPVLYQAIDEIVDNAIDHWTSHPKSVTEIKIYFDKKIGEISVLNNGPGVPVKKTKKRSLDNPKIVLGEVYVPELLFSQPLSGDNLEENEEYPRITGGTNGVGAKLTNIFSKQFIVSTTDTKSGKFYKQKFEDNRNIIHEPEIIKLNDKYKAKILKDYEKKGHTKVSFIPDYENKFGGYDSKSTFVSNLEKIIEARAYHASVFTKAKVYFNDREIKVKNMKEYADMHFTDLEGNEGVSVKIKGPRWKYRRASENTINNLPWEIYFGISNGKFEQNSIINGICVTSTKSNHLEYIKDQIVKDFKPRVLEFLKKEKLLDSKAKAPTITKNHILKNLFIFMKGYITGPQFVGQIKDGIEESDEKLEKFKKYKLTSRDLNKLWDVFEPVITSQFISKIVSKNKEKKTRSRKKNVVTDKYIPANNAGKKNKALKCSLIIAEGDSAKGTIEKIIRDVHNKEISFDYYGAYSIGGVSMNVRKECEIRNIRGETFLKKSKKFQNDTKYRPLVDILGLDYDARYEDNAKGDKEFNKLNYGCIILATDQDEDGKGKIRSLLINFIAYFWPNLVKRGFVKYINTPIIRISSKNKKDYPIEFYSLEDYHDWLNDNFKGYEAKEDELKRKYYVKYYKGLGTHKKTDITQMSLEFDTMIRTYIFDDDMDQNLDNYLGKDTNIRKVLLKTPVDEREIVNKHGEVTVTNHLNTNGKSYQRYDIVRKLPKYDGFSISSRKIFTAAKKIFNTYDWNNAKTKNVASFAGAVKSKMGYHHGEKSLEDSIVRMAQCFKDARNLPILRSVSDGFGSYVNGGSDFAQSRYIDVKLNKKLVDAMFPSQDDYLLDYVFEEGERCEPKCYAPIIPYVLIEGYEIPAHGWKVKIVPRDLWQIFKNIREIIKGERDLENVEKLKFWNQYPSREIIQYKGKEYCVGKCKYDKKKKNTVIISELPYRTFPKPYCLGSKDAVKKREKAEKEGKKKNEEKKSRTSRAIIDKPYVDNINFSKCTEDSVHIEIKLESGGKKYIKENYGNEYLTPLQHYFNLKVSLNSNLNLLGDNDEVIEYENKDGYEKIFIDWFKNRKALYTVRLDRELILLKLKILRLENLIRYVNEYEELGVKGKKIEKAEKILKKAKYQKLNNGLLNNPGYIKTDVLEEMILNPSDDPYGYLLDLRDRDKLDAPCRKREEKLKEFKKLLKKLNKKDPYFKGATVWLNELDELENVIKEGMKYDAENPKWGFGKETQRIRGLKKNKKRIR